MYYYNLYAYNTGTLHTPHGHLLYYNTRLIGTDHFLHVSFSFSNRPDACHVTRARSSKSKKNVLPKTIDNNMYYAIVLLYYIYTVVHGRLNYNRITTKSLLFFSCLPIARNVKTPFFENGFVSYLYIIHLRVDSDKTM